MIIAALIATWCFVADLTDSKSWRCVYDRAQCETIARLRRAGVACFAEALALSFSVELSIE